MKAKIDAHWVDESVEYTETSLLQVEGYHKYKMLCHVPTDYLLSLYKKTKDKALDRYIERVKSKETEQKELVICEKLRFTTYDLAQKALNKISEAEQAHKRPVRAYNCDKCGMWHLSSKPQVIHKIEFNQPIPFGKYEGKIFSKFLYEKDLSYWEWLEERNVVEFPFTYSKRVKRMFPEAKCKKSESGKYSILTEEGMILSSNLTTVREAWREAFKNITAE